MGLLPIRFDGALDMSRAVRDGYPAETVTNSVEHGLGAGCDLHQLLFSASPPPQQALWRCARRRRPADDGCVCVCVCVWLCTLVRSLQMGG
eukprot:SAG25_NODE_9452_length_372_cov_0.673993_1_plen_90_part_01